MNRYAILLGKKPPPKKYPPIPFERLKNCVLEINGHPWPAILNSIEAKHDPYMPRSALHGGPVYHKCFISVHGALPLEIPIRCKLTWKNQIRAFQIYSKQSSVNELGEYLTEMEGEMGEILTAGGFR